MPDRAGGHDRHPGVLDQAPAPALAEAVGRLRLEGAIFLRGEYTEAWEYQSVPGADAAAILSPGSERVILLHVVASGRAWVEVEGAPRKWADTGDVIVLPYGDAHRMGGSHDAPRCVALGTIIDPPPWEQMPVIRYGGGGAATEVVCGYLDSDDPLFDPRLRALPPVFVVSPPDGPARDFVRASIDYAAQQSAFVSADHFEAPTAIPQLLLIEVLKLHLASAPAAEHGWLRAVRDPVLAPALAAIHGEPARKWSVAALAREARVSESVLDERFREVLGLAPIRYLAGWRMHLAADMLRASDVPVAVAARRVGYDSEEAFSRAFKRAYGEAPSIWRVRRHR